MNGDGVASAPAIGSVFDDGVDLANGHFNQSAAFTCNIVAAKVVQCVKGPAYSGGVSYKCRSVVEWFDLHSLYGDSIVVSGRLASLLGYVGGQSFPFTAGSGYHQWDDRTDSDLLDHSKWRRLPLSSMSRLLVARSSMLFQRTQRSHGNRCRLDLHGAAYGLAAARGSDHRQSTFAPVEGGGGIGTYNTDNNTMGMFLYDNSGEPGNPLNSFFTNGMGGYFEPGLPLRPFGQFQGAAVSG